MKINDYEAPSVKLYEVSMAGKILDGSIQASRQSYVSADSETWE